MIILEYTNNPPTITHQSYNSNFPPKISGLAAVVSVCKLIYNYKPSYFARCAIFPLTRRGRGRPAPAPRAPRRARDDSYIYIYIRYI